MKKVLLGLLAGLSMIAMVGCGGGGGDPVGLCNATCDKVAACSMGAITADACKTQADCAHAKSSTCKNNDAITSCVSGCNGGTCDNYNSCLQACPACQM